MTINDLPEATRHLRAWMECLQRGESLDPQGATTLRLVDKSKIADGGDFHLSGERYRPLIAVNHSYPQVAVRDLVDQMKPGFACGNASLDIVGLPHLRPMNINERGQLVFIGTKYISADEMFGKQDYMLKAGDVLFNNTNSKELVGKTCFIDSNLTGAYSNHMTRIRVIEAVCNPRYLAILLHNCWTRGQFLNLCNKWVGQAAINTTALQGIQIPCPTLAEQKEIVAEIEGYQKVIDGSRQVIDNYKSRISIRPDWLMVELGDVCSLISGQHIDKEDCNGLAKGYCYLTGPADFGDLNPIVTKWTENPKVIVNEGAVLVTVKGSGIGKINLLHIDNVVISRQLMAIKSDVIQSRFLFAFLSGKYDYFQSLANGAAIPGVTRQDILGLKIPLLDLEAQKTIVAQIEKEQCLVNANKELIRLFENKIKATINRVWSEAE